MIHSTKREKERRKREIAIWAVVASEYQKYSSENIQLIVIHRELEEKKKAKLINIVTKKSNLHDH